MTSPRSMASVIVEPTPRSKVRGLALPPRAWLAVAATALGVGLWFSDGHLDPGGVPFLILTWGAVIAAFTSRVPDDTGRVERVLGIALVVQLAFLVARPPGRDLLPGVQQHLLLGPVHPVACMLMAMGAASILVERPLLGRATFPAVVALFGIASTWIVLAAPHPPIDVVDFEREAAQALAQGRNPYDLHFPNIYENTSFFGPGFATDRSIDVGLVYPPLTLLLTSLGEWIARDARAVLVVAYLAAAVLIDRLGGRVARLAALLFLSSPRRYFVLEYGWTEPLLVAFLALTLLLARRRSRWLPLAFGGLVALKQFGVVFLPFTPFLAGELWPGRRTRRLLAGAAVVVAVTVLPFLLWDAHAFIRSTVLFHLAQPFRPDSLNFAALWAWARGGVAPPTTVPTLVLGGASVLWALRRCRPTPAGFAAAAGLVFLSLLAWSKQAHCNYYDLVIGTLLCAVAAAGSSSGPTPSGRTVP